MGATNCFLSSSATGSFTISKLGTTLSLSGPAGGILPGADSNVYATLRDADSHPLSFRSVIFVAWDGTHPGFVRQVSTGSDGRAALGSVPAVGPGAYSVSAFYNGLITLDPWAVAPSTITLTDPIYDPSVAVPAGLVIRGHQTITFGALGGKTYGDADFGVSAAATSGLAVSFTSTTPATCSVSGSTVHIVGAGICSVRASQSGNTIFDPAPAVTQSFTIAQRALDVTATDRTKTYGDTLVLGTTAFTTGAGQLVGGDAVNGVTLASPGRPRPRSS